MLRLMTKTQKRSGDGEQQRLHDEKVQATSNLPHRNNSEGCKEKQSRGKCVQVVQQLIRRFAHLYLFFQGKKTRAIIAATEVTNAAPQKFCYAKETEFGERRLDNHQDQQKAEDFES